MNAIYKVIWNDALRLYQVVNEMCRSRRKACSVKAVHMEGSGRTLKRSVLATAAAVTMMAGGGAFAMDLPGMVIDLGGGRVTTELPTYEVADLPSAGESIEIDLRESSFTGLDQNIFNQDEADRTIGIFRVNGSWSAPDGLQITFVDENGDPVPSGLLGIDNNNFATFLYDVNFGGYNSYTHLAQGSFVLKQIDLTEDNGTYGQYLEVGTEVQDSPYPDLKATLTGGGNITFGYGGTAQHGYLTLAGDGTNTYSGRTFVGYTSDGQKSAAPTTIFFGKTEAFGNTLNLNVESDSEVFISGESKTEDYFQRVHGLQGEGLIDLGTRANLELAQSGKTTGNYDDAEGVIRIDNKFTGSGNTTDPASGAWIDIKLSDAVAGDIVRFSNDASEYTGVIALTDATIEGYDATRKLDLNGGTYSPNKILTTSTLRLESGGQLLIDGTSVDSLYNLVLNNNQGWTDDGNNRNALSFKNVQLGEAALNVTGKLTLESDGTVSIDNLTDGGLEGAVSGKSFFDADNGLENALIVVSGGIVTNGHELALDGKIKGESGTDVMQGNDHVADAHWKFDDKLVFEDGATSDSFNIRYTLTQIDILDGKTFTLSTEENSATSGQDFSALISGSGDLKVDASGYTVNIGHSGGNTFTGDTEVTDGTNVILTENSGFGTGSGTLTIAGSGSVTLGTGVKQSGSGLSGTGSLVLGSGAEYALTQNSAANITNKIDGSGTLKVDLGSTGHELTFGSTNPFSGWLDLTNGSLNLSKNADALSTSNIILGENTNFTFGSGSKVESLTVTGNADLNADTLIIGGDAVLTVNGALSFDSSRSFDVSNVVVADNINLIDFDGGLVDNKFITAGSVTNAAGDSFGIKVADEDANTSGQQVVRNYTQGGTDPVAETTWTIGSDIDATDTALNAQVQLTKIDVLDGKSLSIAGDASAQKELVAQLSSKSASGSIVFTGGSILVSNSSNDYQVATRIENGTTVTLGASDSLGKTSELANYGSLVIGQGIAQTVTGWDQVASGSIALDGSLTLDQTGGQTIANSFTGNGIFSVDLGGSGNALAFSNAGALTGFTGTLSLSNLLFDVANSTNYNSMLESTDIALNGGAIFNADASGSIHTGDFTFNGGTLKVGDIEAGNNTGAKVSVSGGIVISRDSTIEVEGVKLEGTSNILAADDGIKQTIAEFTGSVSGSLDDLLVTGVGTSEIRNASTDENPAAYGVWSAGDIAEGNKTLDVELTLQKIQLADATNGLKLNASELSTDTTLSATITNYNNTAGKIVFEGGNITIGGSGANTYTGETEVTGGTVTLAKNSGFGNTSKLSIAKGAAVVFGGKNQTVGALEVGSKEDEASNALSGSGTLTLGTGQTGASHIWGSNSFTGTIQLAANHNLAINSIAGIGGNATVGFGDNSVLTIDGATGGTFSTHLSGAGTVAVANSTFNVSGNNTAFTGTWQLGSSGNVTVSGTSTDIDNALGSGATLSFSGGGLSLKLAAGESALTIDEVLSGDGSLVVKGTTGQTFGLSSGGSDFAGTLSLDGIGMTVGGAADSIGAHNASAFSNTDLSLIGDALLTVASGNGAVSTFSDLTVSGGAIRFEGTAGFNADTSSLAELNISGSLNLQSGDIKLTLPGDAEDLTGVLLHSEIIASQSNKFEGLINASGGITGSLDNITINGSGSDTSFSGTQNITGDLAAGGAGNVAYAQYDYKLGTSGNSLGLIFNLSEIDIVGGETLVLTESGALSAVVKNYGTGAGNLTVASGATIELTNKNAYTGVTTVEGTLTAGESGVGNTSELRVESGGRFVNAGANSVGHLVVDAHGTLELSTGQTLGIKQAADQTSTISGAILGAGSLNLDDGELVVHANSGTSGESGWSGTINVGDSGSDAVLTLSGAGALGSGAIVLANSGSVININESTGLTFSNAITGYGTINVNLSGGAFTFGTNQSGLETGSKLNFLDATFSLDDSNNAAVAGSTLIGLSGDSQLISSGESDKNVWGLDLTSGGTIDFGQIDGSGGQLVLSRNDGTWSGSGRIDLSSNNQTTVVFEDGTSQQTGNRFDELNSGSALLSGGGVFDLTLFEGVSDVYLNGSQITGSGTVSISGFQTDVSFSGTGENYYQDADGDGTADDLVAKLYRGGSGSFYYDADEDVIYMRYGIRQIDLQYSDSGRGLRLAADGNGGELSADVTGSGNIVYAGGNIRVSGSNANDYTGSTYVESGASVTLGKTDAFGKTDYLEIAEGGSVSLDDGLSQVVGELAGGGSLSLGSGSSFTINNSQRQDGEDDPAAKDEIVIETAITAASGSTFVINGSGAATADRRASVNFAQEASLSGANFSLENAQLTFDLSDSGNFSYVSVNDTSKFTLGSNSALLIDARNGSASQNYQLNNTLTLSGGLISFDDVLFTTGGQGNTAILNVGTLDVTDVGYIGVSAAIDDNFNILDADTSHFTQALIHYENETEGSREKLEAATSDQMDDSAISNALGDTVAYVEWSGGFVDESESPENTIVMSYQVAKLKLAQGGDAAGLVLDATGHDSELSVLITDDEQAGSSGGNITFAGGDILITNTNEYTGVTTVATGSATLGAKNGFGNTRLLDVVSGYVNFGGFSQTLGSIDVNSADGIRGSGSVTLGSDAYKDLHSVIRGEQSAFSGNVTLTNGHTLELSDTLGIGSSGTVVLESGTRLVINDQSADNTFSKVVTGEEGATVELSGSGFNIYADNTNYLGDWSLTSGTTASVSGSGSVGVDSILGSGGTVALGTDATLALSQDSGSIVVDNVFAGAGTLVVSGTSDQEFGFSTNWTDAETPGFTGTLRLEDGIKMTVGGGSGSSGFYNAANLANADFKLESGSTLVVATQTGSRVNTFDNLNVNSGTISFAGNFDLGATTEELGQLQVGSLTGSGNIALAIPDSSGTVDRTIGQNDLLTIDDDSHFQALITAETGSVSENGWTLNGSTTTTGSGLRQAVRNADDTYTVAHAIYDYALATGEANSENVSNNDSLGIEYTLKTVDIVDTKTLELSDSGSLSAVITDSSGAGTLLITGQIELTGQNEYESVTRVLGRNASLTVGSSGLGATSSLELSGGATFVNAAGATNSAEKMSSSGSNIVLNKGSELKLTGGASGFLASYITGGSISGSGTLTVLGKLNVSGSIVDEGFTGQIKVGSADKIFGSGLRFYSTESGYAGLGTGEVAFSSSGDAVYIYDGESTTGSTTLTNTYTGNGEIKVVNYGSGSLLFDFSANQAEKGNFTGTLLLQDADYHLYEDAGELKNATLMVSGGSHITVNSAGNVSDRAVGKLELAGGELDFGEMTEGSDSGQIVVGGLGDFTTPQGVIKVALGENNNATGSDVFDLNKDLSVQLIEGFDATDPAIDLSQLQFSSVEERQQVKQSDRYADGSATAVLTYSSGHLVGNTNGIGASWTLSKINLLSGNGSGFLIDASDESSQSGTISADITGEGSIEFAGGTITLNHANNTYTGNTYVTDGELVLAANEALGDSALLEVTGSGTVSVGSTAQSIGSISVAGENGLSMDASGSLTLTSGASTISSANNGVSGTVARVRARP